MWHLPHYYYFILQPGLLAEDADPGQVGEAPAALALRLAPRPLPLADRLRIPAVRRPPRDATVEELVAYFSEPENWLRRPPGVNRFRADVVTDLIAYRTELLFAPTEHHDRKKAWAKAAYQRYREYWYPLRHTGWYRGRLRTLGLEIVAPPWHPDDGLWTRDNTHFPDGNPEATNPFARFLAAIGVTPEMADSWAEYWTTIHSCRSTRRAEMDDDAPAPGDALDEHIADDEDDQFMDANDDFAP